MVEHRLQVFTGVDQFLSFLGIRGQRVFVDKNGDAEVDLILMDMRWGFTGTLSFVYQTKCTVIEYKGSKMFRKNLFSLVNCFRQEYSFHLSKLCC